MNEDKFNVSDNISEGESSFWDSCCRSEILIFVLRFLTLFLDSCFVLAWFWDSWIILRFLLRSWSHSEILALVLGISKKIIGCSKNPSRLGPETFLACFRIGCLIGVLSPFWWKLSDDFWDFFSSLFIGFSYFDSGDSSVILLSRAQSQISGDFPMFGKEFDWGWKKGRKLFLFHMWLFFTLRWVTSVSSLFNQTDRKSTNFVSERSRFGSVGVFTVRSCYRFPIDRDRDR